MKQGSVCFGNPPYPKCQRLRIATGLQTATWLEVLMHNDVPLRCLIASVATMGCASRDPLYMFAPDDV